MSKDRQAIYALFCVFFALIFPVKTSRTLDSQGSAMDQHLVRINAKTAPYPAARSWLGGRMGMELGQMIAGTNATEN